jgi:hypothetical protein
MSALCVVSAVRDSSRDGQRREPLAWRTGPHELHYALEHRKTHGNLTLMSARVVVVQFYQSLLDNIKPDAYKLAL